MNPAGHRLLRQGAMRMVRRRDVDGVNVSARQTIFVIFQIVQVLDAKLAAEFSKFKRVF